MCLQVADICTPNIICVNETKKILSSIQFLLDGI